MKKLLLLSLLIYFTQIAFAQKNNEAEISDFINWRFKLVKRPLVIADCLSPAIFKNLKESLSKDTFYRRVTYDNNKTIVVDTLVITKSERFYIDSLFSDIQNFKWNNGAIKDASLISNEIIDSLSNSYSLSAYLMQSYHANSFYYVSIPIFFKNYTYCLLYDETCCQWPSGNGGSLIIWKKTNEGWKVYWIMSEWVS